LHQGILNAVDHDEWPYKASPGAEILGVSNEGTPMRPVLWIAIALLLVGAILLVAGVGAAGLWIGVITVGIALVAVDRARGRHSLNR
jgi:hypothetical protein